MNENFDSSVTWTNGYYNTYNKRHIEACSECERCKGNGMDPDEAEEVMLSKGFGDVGLKGILDKVFGKQGKPSKKKIQIMIVPTSYEDIAPLVEHRMASLGPEELVKLLTESDRPLIEANPKYRAHLVKMAQLASEGPSYAMAHFHDEVAPYIEEAMLRSVLEAENNPAEVLKAQDGKFEVRFSSSKRAMVDLNDGTSDSDRFVKGNFAEFGLADEFMVKAHDEFSPCLRMSKTLSR